MPPIQPRVRFREVFARVRKIQSTSASTTLIAGDFAQHAIGGDSQHLTQEQLASRLKKTGAVHRILRIRRIFST
jgi:hypothetical protein